MKCKQCQYDWEYKGKSYYAQCPRCRSLTDARGGKNVSKENEKL